jgi:hypothetical protein
MRWFAWAEQQVLEQEHLLPELLVLGGEFECFKLSIILNDDEGDWNENFGVKALFHFSESHAFSLSSGKAE